MPSSERRSPHTERYDHSDVSAPDRLELVHQQMYEACEDTALRRELHALKARRAQRLAQWCSISAAVLASASALSVVSEQKWLAAGLAVASALASAYIAKAKPETAEAAHHKASCDYDEVLAKLSAALMRMDVVRRTEYIASQGRVGDKVVDTGHYASAYELDDKGRREVARTFDNAQARLLAIRKAAPLVTEHDLAELWDVTARQREKMWSDYAERMNALSPDSPSTPDPPV